MYQTRSENLNFLSFSIHNGLHGRKGKNNASRSNKTSHYGIMGGLAPSTNIAQGVKRFRLRRARNQQVIPLMPIPGLQYMKDKNILSKNPAGSGGVGLTKVMVDRSMGPCNCGIGKHGAEAARKTESLGGTQDLGASTPDDPTCTINSTLDVAFIPPDDVEMTFDPPLSFFGGGKLNKISKHTWIAAEVVTLKRATELETPNTLVFKWYDKKLNLDGVLNPEQQPKLSITFDVASRYITDMRITGGTPGNGKCNFELIAQVSPTDQKITTNSKWDELISKYPTKGLLWDFTGKPEPWTQVGCAQEDLKGPFYCIDRGQGWSEGLIKLFDQKCM